MNDDTLRFLEQFAKRRKGLTGFKGQEIYKLSIDDVYYFEVVDNHAFFYREKENGIVGG